MSRIIAVLRSSAKTHSQRAMRFHIASRTVIETVGAKELIPAKIACARELNARAIGEAAFALNTIEFLHRYTAGQGH